MKRMKMMGMALVAVFAVSAVAAGSAVALPEIGRCVAKTGGKYLDSNCTKKGTASNPGSFEFLKGVVKDKFTSAGGEATLIAQSGNNVVCTTQSATGKYDADGTAFAVKGVENVIAKFNGCAIPTFGISCNTKGKAAGEIVTKELEGNLGYINKTTKVVGQELKPKAKTAFAEFECGAGVVTIKVEAATTNCIIAPVGPVNTMSTTAVQSYETGFEGKPYLQNPQKFSTSTKVCQLESAVNGGEKEKSGQVVETTITNEEPLEIKA